MEQYQIGNEVKGIIRAYCPGPLGNQKMQFANEPYTIVDGISATVNFKNLNREGNSATNRVLYHDMSFVDSITLSNVKLTDKIINLIFPHMDINYRHLTVNKQSDSEKHIFLMGKVIYNVFIYNSLGQLEDAYESIDLSVPIEVQNANDNYLIIYDEPGEYAVNLDKTNNFYLVLDLELVGNIDDDTSHMWMHFSKCGLQVDKNMYFSQTSNAIDLTFKVISDRTTNNYITLK